MKRILFTNGFIIISTLLCEAQINNFTFRPDASVFKKVSHLGWVKFQDNYKIKPVKVFENNKKAFGLTENYEMKLVSSNNDEFGYTHIEFQQTYNDIKVLGGEYLIHAKNGRAFTGNGKIYTPATIKSEPILSEKAALKLALTYINAKAYYWEDPKIEARLKLKTGNPAATYYPKATWAYVLSPGGSSLLLCYSFIIETKEFGKSAICYIDASTGALIKRIPLDSTCDGTTINSNWYGIQGISTNDVAIIGHSYDLEDDCQSSVYSVYDATDDDDIFNTGNNLWESDWLRSAATSLWSIKKCYIWFKSFFGRDGHDDDDQNLEIYQGYYFGSSVGNNQASYSYDPIGDDKIKVGIGNTNSPLDDYNALDILAHEFTHGVTKYEAELGGEKDPGALNESFSDIFGEWIEYKTFGSNNWLLGWDRTENGFNQPLRYMKDPAAQNINVGGGFTINFTNPNTYLGTSFVPTNTPMDPGDKWGIHINCGVQNQMFYLLSVGGSGWNNGNTCHAAANDGFFWFITGISRDNAARIAYKVLTDYLTSGSTYPDARNAWVAAAENIFGICSYEAIQTGKAWAAVGIGPPVAQTILLCNETYGSAPYTLVTPRYITTNAACTVTVLSTENLIEFKSGNKITLNPGFTSFAGSNFRASIISDCRFAEY